jgi:hypothetical protein
MCDQEGLELNWTQEPAACDDVNLLNKNIHSIKKDTKIVLDASKEVGVEENALKTK